MLLAGIPGVALYVVAIAALLVGIMNPHTEAIWVIGGLAGIALGLPMALYGMGAWGRWRYLWAFVDGRPVQNRWHSMAEVPAETDASRAMSRELRRQGFSFVGPTIDYAFMQSAGMVNDHVVDCFRHAEVAALG